MNLALARLAVYCGYLRGVLLRMRGAKLAARVRIDSGCHFERPEGLSAGTRVHIEPNATIKIVSDAGLAILGERVFIGRNSVLDISGRLVIGARSLIAPGCFITDHNHGISPEHRIVDQGVQTRTVEIGADAWIGANASILPGVRIGDGAVIGAGAVVTRDVPDNAVAVGVPARVIRYRHAD